MQLYKPVQHRLSAYCRVVTGNEEMALDLVQDTITATFESFHKLRNPGSFQFFLIGIARNCHLKHQRTRKFFGKQSDIKPSNIEVTSDSVEMRHDVELIHQCIARLNDEQREVILLFHIMGFSLKEIADNLSVTEAAVKNRLARGRENLKRFLSDRESNLIERISAKQPKNVEK